MATDPRQLRLQAIARTSIVGAAVNLALSALKIAAGVFGQSYALIVDGIHSLSDLLSDLLVWVAGRQASRSPDQDHPYGHARFETLATLVLGVVLGGVALGIAWDALQRLLQMQSLDRPGLIAVLAASISIGMKEWLYRYTLGFARRVGSEMLRANAWHHRTDALSSVIVLVGVVGTLMGINYLDSLAAIAVCFMIVKIAWDLVWEAIRELVDTGLDPERVAAMRRTILSVSGVRDVHMLRTRRLGGNATADVHVLVDPRVSVSEGHMISLLVEERLKEKIDEVVDVTVHIDPEDDEEGPPCEGLPPRSEVLARLDSLWSDIPAATRRQRTVLHYLDGQVDVEVFFPLSAYSGGQDEVAALSRRLAAALRRDPVFRRVSVYFGGHAPD